MNGTIKKRKYPTGRILKLKLGVNPNSSSMATVSKVFTWSILSCSVIFNTAAAFFLAVKQRAGKQRD